MVPAACGVIQQDTHLPLAPPPSLADHLALSRLLIAPGAPVMALAPDGRNGGDHLGTGELDTLAAAHPGAALLGRIRPDLVAVDFDGTAEFLADVDTAAESVGAVPVYLARSGSVDSLHAVYAASTTAARAALVEAVALVDDLAGGGVDGRTPAEWLRLPGSPSLKAGCGAVEPVDRCGVALTPTEALAVAKRALAVRVADRSALGVPFDVAEFAPVVLSATPEPDSGDRSVSTRRAMGSISSVPGGGLVLDQRAWDALREPCPGGEDVDQTLHALRAAWHLYRCGGRSWADVAGVVMTADALTRWRLGGIREAKRRWVMESAKWAGWLPAMATEDALLVAEVLAMSHVLPADLEVVLWAVVGRMSSMGRTADVGVAERDLVVWGVASSRRTAGRALDALWTGGVLRKTRRYDDGPITEATEWALNSPALWQVETPTLNGGTICTTDTHPLLGAHPVWLTLGAPLRRTLGALLAHPAASTATLAALVGLRNRAVRNHLTRLEDAGLAVRSRSGRSVTWSVSLDGWESLPVVLEAEAALLERRREVAAERAAWRELVEWVPPAVSSGVASSQPVTSVSVGQSVLPVVHLSGSQPRVPGRGDLVLSGLGASPPG